MAVTPKRLIAGSALTTSAAVYYTAPTNTRAIVKQLTLCNTDSVPHTVDIHIVPSGGSPVVANQVYQDVTLAAKETKSLPLSDVLEAGMTLQAFADAGSVVSIAASGVEVT